MSTQFATTKSRWLQVASAVAALLAISISTDGFAATDGGIATDTDSETRTSVTSRIGKGGRRGNADGSSTNDEYAALRTDGERAVRNPSQSTGKSSATASIAAATLVDFWIYDADVVLFSDDDRDGHYYGIDLWFDADTIYSVAEVYAVVYLSYEGGPWNEYAVTEDFTIFGASSDDEYVLITELMSGYPRGDYDILIELFDAYDSSYLAAIGPEDSPELSFLPLEDFNRDTPPVTEVSVSVSQGSGGGSTGLWLMLALLAVVIRRSLPRRGA